MTLFHTSLSTLQFVCINLFSSHYHIVAVAVNHSVCNVRRYLSGLRLVLFRCKNRKNHIQRRKDHQRTKYITLKTKETDHIIPHQSRLLHVGGTPPY